VRFKVDDIFMHQTLTLIGLFLVCGCAVQSAPPPLACNPKAFTPAERLNWRRQLDHVMSSVSAVRDLADGYSFEIDSHRASLLDLARWIDLERKGCPFFTFELGANEGGNVWLNLRGREGVKEFIA